MLMHQMEDISLRPFGMAACDLNLDFGQSHRVNLVTQVLQSCVTSSDGRPLDASFLWELAVAKRIEYLLRIVASGGVRELSVQLHCPDQPSRELMEVDIPFQKIIEFQPTTSGEDEVSVRVGGDMVRLRRPRGSDQLQWYQASYDDEGMAIDAAAKALIVEPASFCSDRPVPGEAMAAIERAMQEFDPLVNFSLRVGCFFCDGQHLYEIDLAEMALDTLRKTQGRLVEEIHRLAMHYHWSEEEIVSLPAWRRARYLALIEREAGP